MPGEAEGVDAVSSHIVGGSYAAELRAQIAVLREELAEKTVEVEWLRERHRETAGWRQEIMRLRKEVERGQAEGGIDEVSGENVQAPPGR